MRISSRVISATPSARSTSELPCLLGAERVICIPLSTPTPHKSLEVVVKGRYPCLRRRCGLSISRKSSHETNPANENSPYRFEELSRFSQGCRPLKRRNDSFTVVYESNNSRCSTPLEPRLTVQPAPGVITVQINKRRRREVRSGRSPLPLRSIRVHHISSPCR